MKEVEDAIHYQVVVQLPQQEAFDLFTEGFARWWPQEYTWSQDALDTIGIEPCEGGRCTERGPHGFQCDWGRVLAWSPPERLLLAWQIGPARQPQPNPHNASTIEIVFHPEEVGVTRVMLEHREFQHHGEGASQYREAMASEYGWPFILERYAQAAGA